MEPSVDGTISDLRQALSATSDSELARKLNIDKSTISSWRSRGRVPARFINLIGENPVTPSHEPPNVWGELQEKANALALLRFALLRADLAKSGNADRVLAIFRDMRPFWLILNRSIQELRSKEEALAVDITAAQAILMHEDLRDPDATARRLEQQLDEDFSDNNWLEDYR